MGISDEDYAKELEKLRWGAAAHLNSVTLSTSNTTTGALHYPANVAGHIGMKAKDLDHEAAKVSLNVLADMWVIRWQDNWVTKEQLVEDDFWRIAYARLDNVNRLERHMLADNMQYVYRIIE